MHDARKPELDYEVLPQRSDTQRARDAAREAAEREKRLIPPAPTTDSTVIGPRKKGRYDR